MVRRCHQFNLMPSEGRRLAGYSPNPVAKSQTDVTLPESFSRLGRSREGSPPQCSISPAVRSRNFVAACLQLTLLQALESGGVSTSDFPRMLEWKLLRGSHEFPGPDG